MNTFFFFFNFGINSILDRVRVELIGFGLCREKKFLILTIQSVLSALRLVLNALLNLVSQFFNY